jgi:predicted transcriptional regulator
MMFRVLLNVLSLLKREPKSFDELFASGLFPRWEDLEYQLAQLKKIQIIISNEAEDDQVYYTLTNLGRSILRSYPNAKLKEIDLVYNPKTRSYIKLVQPSFPVKPR